MLLELASEKIEIGRCVIIDDIDQPAAGNIAVVKSVTPERVTALYLSTRISMKECYGPPGNVTPVGDFGVRVLMYGSKYWCERTVADSKATYRDGKPRGWQEPDGYTCKPKLAPLRIVTAIAPSEPSLMESESAGAQ